MQRKEVEYQNTSIVFHAFLCSTGTPASLSLTCVDGDGEAFHRGDSERAEQRADADVDEDVGLTEARTAIQHEHRTQHQHQRHIHQKTCTRTHTGRMIRKQILTQKHGFLLLTSHLN